MPETENALIIVGQNQEEIGDAKVDESSKEKSLRYSAAEKQNFLADQKVNAWSNEETAERAGVSEATIRRWQNRAENKNSATKPKTKRPKTRTQKQPSDRGARSVTKMREQLEEAHRKIAELEAELSVVKPLAKFYFK